MSKNIVKIGLMGELLNDLSVAENIAAVEYKNSACKQVELPDQYAVIETEGAVSVIRDKINTAEVEGFPESLEVKGNVPADADNDHCFRYIACCFINLPYL